ncbi:hypothetical protein LCGC14_0813620 [marine sediment metagenome]|uniref:Uncharacterized protein n=1 Tax=marine sediment metagenome TaxID=412755 RepID=A0A0F9PKV2_9ZZZZ
MRIIREGDEVRCLPNGRLGRVQSLELYRTHGGIDYFVKYDEPIGDAHYAWYRQGELELRRG